MRESPPDVLVEWVNATQAYVEACHHDLPIKRVKARAARAWLAIKDSPYLEIDPEGIELMDEIMRPLQ